MREHERKNRSLYVWRRQCVVISSYGRTQQLIRPNSHRTSDATCMQIGTFFPLMLLASSVNTPIDNNRSHLLALPVRVLFKKNCKIWLKFVEIGNWLGFQEGGVTPVSRMRTGRASVSRHFSAHARILFRASVCTCALVLRLFRAHVVVFAVTARCL